LPATILFSQLPEGHAAIVLFDRVGNEEVIEAHVKLAAVPERGAAKARPAVPHKGQRNKLPAGSVSAEELARMGADLANALAGGQDPQAYAPFPVDEDPLSYRVASLRPALALGRDFLDRLTEATRIPSVEGLRKRLTGTSHPLRYEDSPINKLGVESGLLSLLHFPGGFGVRAHLVLKQPQPVDALAMGVSLRVVVTARVYDPSQVNPAGGLPLTPLAEGPPVRCIARLEEQTVVDLVLPPVAPPSPAGYLVVAKVFSDDPLYRAPFDPSDCYGHIMSWS